MFEPISPEAYEKVCEEIPVKRVMYKALAPRITQDIEGNPVEVGPAEIYIASEYAITVDKKPRTIKWEGDPIQMFAPDWTIMLDPENNTEDLAKYYFLFNHPNNINSKKHKEGGHRPVFKILDISVEETEKYDKEIKRLDVENKINTMPIDALCKLYRIYKDNGENVDLLNDKQLRLRVLKLSKNTDRMQHIIDTFDSPDTKLSIDIQEALDFGIIVEAGKKIKWFESGTTICNSVAGQTTAETLKAYINNTTDGQALHTTIKEKIAKPSSKQ